MYRFVIVMEKHGKIKKEGGGKSSSKITNLIENIVCEEFAEAYKFAEKSLKQHNKFWFCELVIIARKDPILSVLKKENP